jgi:hypothetical protein
MVPTTASEAKPARGDKPHEDFFHSRVRERLRDHALYAYDKGALATGLEIKEHPSTVYWSFVNQFADSLRDVSSHRSGTVRRTRESKYLDKNIANLVFAVKSFAGVVETVDLEARIRRIEQFLEQALAEQPPAIAARSTSSFEGAAVRAKELVPTISHVFKESFGVTPETVAITPSADEDHLVAMTIDASGGDPAVLGAARAAGARAKFYKLLLDGLAQEDFDLLSFEFIFPTP